MSNFIDDMGRTIKKTYKMTYSTSKSEIAEGIAKSQYNHLYTEKGFGRSIYGEMVSNGLDESNLPKGFEKAIKSGNIEQATKIADDNDDLLSQLNAGNETVNRRYNYLKERMYFNKKGKATGFVSDVDKATYAEALEEQYDNAGIFGKASIGISAAQSYFTTPGKGAKRIGAAAVAYGGVNLAGRALTGGNATRNSSGERDIAGVPFI